MSGLRAPPSSSKPLPKIRQHHSPLTTDRNGNTVSVVSTPPAPLHFLDHDPSTPPTSVLLPKQGASVTKLKIKSATTPEAKTRLLAKTPVAMRTPAPSLQVNHGMAMPSSIKLVTPRPIPSRDSDSSLADWSRVDETLLGMENEDMGETETVSVTVRVRPPNDAELKSNTESSVWDTPTWDDHLIKLPKGPVGGHADREWIFDRILPPASDNAKAYATSARAHVRASMEGYNAVIFAYGQTASGKTFTLSGSPSQPGIIPLAISDLFGQIRRTPDREFLLRASYLELYNESIIDLLSPSSKELSLSEGKKKGEVVINGLTECAVRSEDDVRGLLRVGEESRKVGQTDWNARSSRSHCVFRITIESRASNGVSEVLPPRTPGGKQKSAGEKMTRISTLSIIDLAGSEKHTSSKERNVEGRHINQSLLTLKLVISKLADMASKRNVTHVPYRDSKLTRLLQPSLSGDALISVICTLSPSSLNISESLSTLSFAQGLKRVVLKAQKKEVVDPQALIEQYQNEIAKLRALLREREKDSSPMNEVGGGGASKKSGGSEKVDLEKRLEELKSMILTKENVQVGESSKEARPLSPMKLRYPKLDFDRSTTELQESLHAAQIRISQQDDQISHLKRELGARPHDPDKRIVELQDEIAGLKLIADDYERHLAEPSRKVREDVEKEYMGRIERLESQLESKKIWANRLDENVRAVSAENRALEMRCHEAEHKVLQIMEWINTFLDPSATSTTETDGHSSSPMDPSGSSGSSSSDGTSTRVLTTPNIPTLVVSQDVPDDFGPTSGNGTKQATLTLSAKMARGMSTMDLASFSQKFGTLTVGRSAGGSGSAGRSGGMRMLREESGFNLAGVLDDDETF